MALESKLPPDATLPESLRCKPNIPWEQQTIDQLKAERAYWAHRLSNAAGPASAGASFGFLRACDAWIAQREREVRS